MNRYVILALLSVTDPALARELTLTSPDGQVRITVSDQGGAHYSVDYRGERVLNPSGLGMQLSVGGYMGESLAITGASTGSADGSWKPVAGRASQVRDRYNTLTVDFAEPAGGRQVRLVFRAYDDGVAFRYVFPEQPALAGVNILSETTRFQFAGDYTCLGFNVGKFGSSHEGEFDPVRTSTLRPHNLFDRPFVCRTDGGHGLAITEADLRDWSAMYLKGSNGGGETQLSPRIDDPLVAVRTRMGSEVASPWRVVMLAPSPGALHQSSLIETLNPPPFMADTSWIKPGKIAWDWWHGPSLRAVAKPGMNMATLRALIDFAAASGFPYLMIDEGWYAGAGGGGVVRPGANIIRTAPGINMPELVDYARQRGVGLFLWLNWKALDAQMDEALDLYAAWGIKGVKVDFMDRDDQEMVAWFHRVLRETARRRLMVDLHGAYPPTGLTRTYPHLLTQEGVMGAEYTKFSSRISATHDVRLAYTRNLLGTMDYTPGGFGNVAPAEFAPRWMLPMVPHTRAHGLAMYVVYDSPLQFVADTPDRYAESPESFDFIRAVPTSWDETRFVAGEFGETIAIARRHGREWWLGALTGAAPATLRVPLDFLGSGRWRAEIGRDGARPTDLIREHRAVSASDVLELPLAATGGAIVRITAAEGHRK